MNSVSETDKRELQCPDCEVCNFWILRICADCERPQWVNRCRVKRWCDYCLQDYQGLLQRLSVETGIEGDRTRSYQEKLEKWHRYIFEQSNIVLWKAIECDKSVPVPQTWEVNPDKWEETKRRCRKKRNRRKTKSLQEWAKY